MGGEAIGETADWNLLNGVNYDEENYCNQRKPSHHLEHRIIGTY